MSHKKREAVALRFPSVPSIELPASHAKHRQIVSQVLKDLRKLDPVGGPIRHQADSSRSLTFDGTHTNLPS